VQGTERTQIETQPPHGHTHAQEMDRRGPPREVDAGVRVGATAYVRRAQRARASGH
jgi:hypothetical protein